MGSENNKELKARLVEAGLLYAQMRWFFITTLIVTGLLSRLFTAGGAANVNFSPIKMLGITIFCFFINIFYFWFYRHEARFSGRAVMSVSVFQIMLDVVLMMLILFLAGGIISVSFIYMSFSIVASGFFYSYRGVLVITTIIGFLYGGIIWGQYFNLIPYLPRYNNPFEYQLAHNLAAVAPNTFTIILTLYFIGLYVALYSRNIKIKEQEIRKERDKEKALIAGLADGLVYVDQDGLIDQINPAAERIFKIKAATVIGKPLNKRSFEQYPLLAQVMSNETKEEYEVVSADSPDTYLRVVPVEIKNFDEKVIGFAKIIHDVSRERFMEKMKSEFITIAGHQLRTPLSAIKNALSMLRNGDFGLVSDEQESVIGQSFEYTERMIQLVNDLLSASEIEEGRYDYKFTPVDFPLLIKDILERFKFTAEQKHITLETSIVHDPFLVSVDIYRLKLALGNVINNAITYTPAGGWVTVECDFSDKQKLQISIADTGIGIEAAEQGKIFSKFFRGSNAIKFNTEGNGLDLFIAKNIIEQHEGRIWTKSKIGEGATFYIQLPAEQSGLQKKGLNMKV